MNGTTAFSKACLLAHPPHPAILVPATASRVRATGCATAATTSPNPAYFRAETLGIGEFDGFSCGFWLVSVGGSIALIANIYYFFKSSVGRSGEVIPF